MKKQVLALALALGMSDIFCSVSAGGRLMSDDMTLSEIVAAAKSGNAEAQFLLGNALTTKKGHEANFALGITFLELAAKQDHALASHNLAVNISHGWVKGKTKTDAFNLYLGAAQAGFAGSQNNLGDMYEKGEGTATSFGDAIHWYTRAAMQGEPTAYLSLGQCYLNGIGVARNTVEAYRWFLLASKKLRTSPNNKLSADHSLQELKKTMSAKQIEEGQRLADRYVPQSQAKHLMGDPPSDK